MASSQFRVLTRNSKQIEEEKQRQQTNKLLLIFLFVAPGMIVFTLFFLMPIAQSGVFSFYRWEGFGPLDNFVGFQNYERLLGHSVFQASLQHSLIIMVLSLFIQLPLSLGLALLVGRGQMRGRKIFRTVLFVPYVFSEIVTALIFLYVLHPTSGMLNTVLGGIIPGFEPVGWLANRETVLYGIFFVLTWKYFGFHMILYMAGLQSVPKDLEEAARVDGAREPQVLWFITLPMLGSTIRLSAYLSVLGAFQQFVIVWVLTEGGPVNASELIATYLYKFGIQRFALGYGSAVAVVLFLITLIFSLGYQRIIMRRDYAVNYE